MAKLYWPVHRGVAVVRLLFGVATHSGKEHPSVDSLEAADKT